MSLSWRFVVDNDIYYVPTGIPKFYRWLSERYPLVNQPIAETNVPEVDNLYLDMNGIIHNCTHGNDPGTKLTETEMIIKVFNYLEKLFQIVQPKKLLFMAIDGIGLFPVSFNRLHLLLLQMQSLVYTLWPSNSFTY
jgi:hypothetical protein